MQINAQLRRRLYIACGLLVLGAAIYFLSGLHWYSFVSEGLLYVQQEQRVFHDKLADNLHAIKDTGSIWPAFTLILVGFLYGIFHAVGPGHGKIVVTSYMLANERSLRRGLLITVLASLMQAVTAIVLVLGLFFLLGLARGTAERAANLLETASFMLVMLVGIILMLRGAREIWELFRQKHPHAHHHHAHDHHGHECGCGHSHIPDPKTVGKIHDMGTFIAMIFSIGMRPCSGALLLLFFACMIGVVWPGVIATFAMAVGTAITTAALAVAAVQSKNMVLRFMKSSDRGMVLAHAGLNIIGGLIIILVATIFLLAALPIESSANPAAQTISPYDHPLMRFQAK